MTTRPYLVAFAFCVAGAIAFGVPLTGLALGVPYTHWLGWGLGLFPFVFLGIIAIGINEEYAALDRAEKNRQDAQSLTNREREQSLAERLAAAIIATDDDAPDPAADPARHAAWKLALIRFFEGGQAVGKFSQPKLARVIPSSDAWQALTDWYCEQPPGDPVLHRYPGGTNWHWRWTLERALLALAMGELPLPPGPPPTVHALSPEKRGREKGEKGSGAVVEHQLAGE